MILPKAKDKNFWHSLKDNPDYKSFIEQLQKYYADNGDKEIPAVKYSDYIIFSRSGSRWEYEKTYFARRVRLHTLALLCLIYDDEEYLIKLQDTIWAICDEYCWALPAHVNVNNGNDNTFIDLFASETGYTLSEIYYLLSDRLDDLINRRIEAEVERRILTSFETRRFGFETMNNNWSAVCGGSVGITFMYMAPERFNTIKPRIDSAIEYFFSSFEDDGACLEGLGYWSYGFGYFVFYADVLKDFTNGEIDYFKQDRVRAIASFQHKVFLRGNTNATVSFSDGSARGSHVIGLTHYLKSTYPDDVKALPFGGSIINSRWPFSMRSILWYDPKYDVTPSDTAEETILLETSGWYIKKCADYSFACKAGHNQEPHNHNDVGSFLITDDREQILCDLGSGEYTRQYFSSQRYEFLCNRSGGHSVPIINGREQSAGRKFSGCMKVVGGTVEIEMKDAYDIPELKSVRREFSFTDRSVMLRDTFDGVSEVTERFVTKIQPEFSDKTVTVGKFTITYDDVNWIPHIEKTQWSTHGARLEDAYLIDFTPKSADANVFECAFGL